MRKIIRKIREIGLRKAFGKAVQKIDHGIRRKLGLPIRLKTLDRTLLDQKILPLFTGDASIRTVLFVGCDYYTAHYPAMFPQAEFWTIEPRPTKAKYGGKPHITGYLQDLPDHAKPETFDLIVCNGVYGWGLNRREDIEKALRACFNCLKPGSLFIFGWNDVPERTPVPLDSIEALAKFEKREYPELGGWRLVSGSETGHVFDFYRRPL